MEGREGAVSNSIYWNKELKIKTTTLYFSEGQATEAWQQTEGGGGAETPEVAETASSVNMARDTELRPARASHQCHR